MSEELVDKITMLEFKQELKEHLNNVTEVLNEAKAEIIRLTKENVELRTRVENQKSFLERIRAKFNLGEIDRKEIEGYLENDKLVKAKELLRFWVNDFYDNFNNSIRYEERHKTLVETEQFLKELEIHEERLCEHCDQYKSCPDGKRCHTCDNGSKWRRNK